MGQKGKSTMLFNGKECVVVDDALITEEGVRDIVADAMMAIVPLVWGESDAPDDPTPTVVGGTTTFGGRSHNLWELNSTDLWEKNYNLVECMRSPGCGKGRKSKDRK